MARHARISTVAYAPVAPGPQWLERNQDSLVAHLRLAAPARPDLVVFPELAGGREPEPIPGPTFDRVATAAAELGCYVCLPLLEQDGGCVRNTAAFIGRDGRLVGKYHKLFPTIGEMEAG